MQWLELGLGSGLASECWPCHFLLRVTSDLLSLHASFSLCVEPESSRACWWEPEVTECAWGAARSAGEASLGDSVQASP